MAGKPLCFYVFSVNMQYLIYVYLYSCTSSFLVYFLKIFPTNDVLFDLDFIFAVHDMASTGSKHVKGELQSSLMNRAFRGKSTVLTGFLVDAMKSHEFKLTEIRTLQKGGRVQSPIQTSNKETSMSSRNWKPCQKYIRKLPPPPQKKKKPATCHSVKHVLGTSYTALRSRSAKRSRSVSSILGALRSMRDSPSQWSKRL